MTSESLIKYNLRSIESKLGYLREKYPNHFQLWTYNKLIKIYYKEFHGIELPDYFLTLDSVESVARIFRLRFKDKDVKMDKEFKEIIKRM